MNIFELKGNNDTIFKIGKNLFEDTQNIILPYIISSTLHIITDKNVARHHLQKVQKYLSHFNIEQTHHIIAIGERNKSFATLQFLLEEILSCKPTVNSTLIALGGGMVGDIAGFAANILLRGVNWINIPTTLLAQVDSAIGGKCGINSNHGKNLIGSTHNPILTLMDVDFLATLPNKEISAGCAEAIKNALLYKTDFFFWIQKNIDKIIKKDFDTLLYLVQNCCRIKMQITQQDKFGKKGKRNMLNFGHTVAHAIEAASEYEISHGEAVSIGLVVESAISNINTQNIKSTLKQAGLPISLKEITNNINIKKIYSYILNDKKIQNKTLELTLLEEIGKAYTEYVSCDFMYSLLSDSLS